MFLVKRAFFYGFLVWLIPFITAVLIFRIHESNRPLFESIMAVVIVAVAVFFTGKYFRHVEKYFVKEGVQLGVLWLLISVAADFPFFITGPFAMSPMEYVSDIAVIYLIFPLITVSASRLISVRKSK